MNAKYPITAVLMKNCRYFYRWKLHPAVHRDPGGAGLVPGSARNDPDPPLRVRHGKQQGKDFDLQVGVSFFATGPPIIFSPKFKVFDAEVQRFSMNSCLDILFSLFTFEVRNEDVLPGCCLPRRMKPWSHQLKTFIQMISISTATIRINRLWSCVQIFQSSNFVVYILGIYF